ncbi:MAG: efflux RND transporter permease subunit [Bdellovibrio sp.]|nr:efflux RND transporter permease subunit [Bdellovibrio sp.]
MKTIYQANFRVYLCFALLALLGIVAGFDLPISLYPNSTRPTVHTGVSYGALQAREFLETYGMAIESNLKALQTKTLKVEKVKAEYNATSADYMVDFAWGADPKEALREVQAIMNAQSSRWPKEIRDSLWVNFWSNTSGFVAISFFSSKRSLDDLYDMLNPEFYPHLQAIPDAQEAVLWNPNYKEIRITLNPEMLALTGLLPNDVEAAVAEGLRAPRGGNIQIEDKGLQIQVPRAINALEDLKRHLIKTPSQKLIPLSDVATIEQTLPSKGEQIFKTNGNKSLILFASPKSGANVKNLGEDILEITKNVMAHMPADIEYRVLVDPSEFIRNSVSNVLQEVFLAAFLAVLVLFLFVGNIQNTITAALEIPLSMVLAFILMKFAGININLISLGGLALSAGMNVDASIVVMENIFAHMERIKHRLTPAEALHLVTESVKEVRGPVIGSTIASLVVFLPLALTKDLTNAVLGDLSMAVVFSHGLSAIVALFLVPTIRLHLLNRRGGLEQLSAPPIARQINWLENTYERLLNLYITKSWPMIAAPMALTVVLASLLYFGLPRLEKEIIGLPDTDWIILGVNAQGMNNVKEMEGQIDEAENELLSKFGDKILYTFVQIHRKDNGNIMARLKDKSDMEEMWKKIESTFTNTPTVRFWVVPWNPAELPIPNPPSLEVSIKGGSPEDRAIVAAEISSGISEKDIFPNVWKEPSTFLPEGVVFTPYTELWPELQRAGATFSTYDLADLTRVATEGKNIGALTQNNQSMGIYMQFPDRYLKTLTDIKALPIKVVQKIIPLMALGHIERKSVAHDIVREDGQEVTKVFGKVKKGTEKEKPARLLQAKNFVNDFNKTFKKDLELTTTPIIAIENAERDITAALQQLYWSVGTSILLIFFVLYLQFGSIVQALIILSAAPIGLVGVLLSLLTFKSTISLNSSLGVILLSGITVANSIMLADLTLRLVAEGHSPGEAALMAAKRRLRPILITSLTTILGMIPVAIGMGEGGKILRPLGLAVSGGLWFSMTFTLFVVPGLEVLTLRRKQKLLAKDEKVEEETELLADEEPAWQ